MSSIAFNWAMGLDGSRLSWLAFDFVTTLLQRRGIEGEALSVCHISAPEQKAAQVPVLLRPERLESEVDGKNISMRLNIQWVCERREPGVRAGDTLTNMSNKLGADFLVIGCFGRKEKESVYLGHVATSTLKQANAHNFIVKQRPVPLPPKGQPVNWVIASDNSPPARHALDLVLSLMHPDDKLFIYYAAKYESFAKRVQKYHEEQLEKTGRKGEFIFEHVQGRQNYADVICNFAEKKNADVLAIGNRGHSKSAEVYAADSQKPSKLGSVSEFCAEFCPCALLIAKGSGQH